MKNMERLYKHEKIIRFFIVTTFSLLPLALFAAFMVFRIGQVAEERATIEANRLVRVVESQQEQVFRNIRNTLISLMQFAEIDKDHTQAKNCNDVFASLLNHMNKKDKMYNNLILANPKGDVLCGAVGNTLNVNLYDRDYFQMVLQKKDFVIGEYSIGRLTGQTTLPVAYPILDENGEIKLVAIGGLSLEWINDSANRIKSVEKGPILVVTGRYGKIIAQYPEGLVWVGQKFLPKEIEGKTEANFKTLWLNNLPHLFSYVRLPLNSPISQDHLKFYIGIPTSQITNFIEQEIINYILVLLALISIFGSTGWLISKKMARNLAHD